MEVIILYLPLFILIYSFYSLPINPGFPVVEVALISVTSVNERTKWKLAPSFALLSSGPMGDTEFSKNPNISV